MHLSAPKAYTLTNPRSAHLNFGAEHVPSFPDAEVRLGSPEKSGNIPARSMSTPDGVRYLPTVTASPEPSVSSYTLCIRPLPNVGEPATTARQLSRRAPARISDAEADRRLTNTVSGKSCIPRTHITRLLSGIFCEGTVRCIRREKWLQMNRIDMDLIVIAIAGSWK
jgi:hypothetical protein